MIDLKTLKYSIENNSLQSGMLIFMRGKDDDSIFLCNQYKNAILSSKETVTYITDVNNINAIRSSNIFSDSDDFIVCELDILDSLNIVIDDNMLMICNNISDECKIKFNDYIVNFPALEQWQIIDYIKSKCDGLSDIDAKSLAEKCNYSIFRVDSELNKICIFDNNLQSRIFSDLMSDDFAYDVVTYNIFNLVNPIVQHKFSDLIKVWTKVAMFDSDPVYLLSVLLSQYKIIMNVLLLPNSTAEICGISQKQFNFIRYAYKNYSKNQLVNVYEFLTGVNRKLVSGELSDINLLDYIIINTIQKGVC